MGINQNFFISNKIPSNNNTNTNNKILTKMVNSNMKNKTKNNNCMSSRYIYDKIPLTYEMKLKGNLTERLSNTNQNIINNKYFINKSNKIPKTQREALPKKNKISIKESNVKKLNNNNINNNYGYVKERIKKENIIYKKNKNPNNKKSSAVAKIEKNGNTNNAQRPNSSRAFAGKNNNFMDKIFTGNNKYLELQNHNINVNLNQGYNKQAMNKMNVNQGKNFGPYIKIMRTKKLFQ